MSLDTLFRKITQCRACVENPIKDALPHEPRPVCVLSSKAKICIAGQAPGVRVHQSGRPFTDPSGDRLRSWMGIGEDVFYDPDKIAIVPMGFCFPGLDEKGGDLPPRRECVTLWHDQIFAQMSQIQLILIVGTYAQAYHLGKRREKTLTATVANWKEYYDHSQTRRIIPLPHPSWRNNVWIKKNNWFETDLIPVLQEEVSRLVN